MTALNIYSVYEFRRNSTLLMGTFESRFLNCAVTIFLPIVLIKSINYKKTMAIITSVSIFMFYLGNWKHLFNAPAMSADTGFFIEGFARFGFTGLFLSFLLLWIILKKIDDFQEHNGYITAISFFIYPIYFLSEQQILGTIFFGTWMFLVIILIFYDDVYANELEQNKSHNLRGRWFTLKNNKGG